MTYPIIYLPGFNSGPQSEKSAVLLSAFPGLIAASYDTWDTNQGYQQIDSLIQTWLELNPILVGSSLGGFWAYQFASKYNLRCVLVNPCMNPETTLQRYVGPVENFYTYEKGVFTEANLQQFSQYRFAGEPVCAVLHEQGDELIPYQESIENFSGKARLILPEGGNHRFEQVQLIIDEINLMCGDHD